MSIFRLTCLLCIIVLRSASVDTMFPNLGPDLNGMTVHFHRKPRFLGITVKYIHKGILFFPGMCSCPFSVDSGGRQIRVSHPYVIHLWGPGWSKRKSRIRIDPLEEVIHGDKVEIIVDLPGALHSQAAMGRAFSEFGEKHRGESYNLAGNNCGNFVAWAKYGDSAKDVQFWDRSKRIIKKAFPKVGPRMVGVVSKLVRRRFSRKEH